MRSGGFVVVDITRQHMPQMSLANHHDVVEAFSADRADQSFRISVLPGQAGRRRMIANAQRANASDEYVAVTSIPIADQIARDLLPAACRRQLIGNPFRCWMCCNAEPQDLSSAVPHDQQSVEKSERDGRH